MKKFTYMLLAICVLLASCAKPYKYKDEQGQEQIAQPYGWANYKTHKSENIIYEINLPNAILSVGFSETLVIPLFITGTEIFEPVGIKTNTEKKTFLPD